MINQSKWMRRLGVVAVLAIVLVLGAGAPALQAQPEAGTISAGINPVPGPPVQVWNGHNCPANVPVNISGLSAGMGGYETKIAWPAGRFNNTPANVGVNLTTYLAFNGRSTSGSNGTPLLKAVVGDSVKFGDYSWGPDNPVGNSANGQLATVALLPTATCGTANLIMSETQLVDINGSVIALTAQTGYPVSVFRRFDTNGDGLAFITSSDVLAVVNAIGPWGGGCSPGYQFDTNLDGLPFITSSDVLAVVNNIGPATCP